MLNPLHLEHHVWPRPRPREGSASCSGTTCRGQSCPQGPGRQLGPGRQGRSPASPGHPASAPWLLTSHLQTALALGLAF